MATGGNENEEELKSKGLYRLVSDIIGPEAEVKLRRERWNVVDWMENNQGRDQVNITSGSMAEGFDMKTSDIDMMFHSCSTVVVENYSQFENLGSVASTVLLTDCNYSSPGFAMVKCFTRDCVDPVLLINCIWKWNELWISSKLFMEFYLQFHPSASAHGPCQSGDVLIGEYDFAQCLKCNVWPTVALPAILRMRRSGWPSSDVIQEIIKDGCLLVPVASRRPLFEEAAELEWRISFSLAEKRLVHSMNHCQFLCYGLWKIFKEEVLTKLPGVEGLLCSYFLKTVVFWEIIKDPVSWTPSKFISKFFRSLQTLIDFVDCGCCPNFFITDYNMFQGKIYGVHRRNLLSYLKEFYNEGCICLLKCPSFQQAFQPIVTRPSLVHDIATDESLYISRSALQGIKLKYIMRSITAFLGVQESVHEICEISRRTFCSDFESITLTIRKHGLLQSITEKTLHDVVNPSSCFRGNKFRYQFLTFAVNLLRENKTYLGYGDLILAKALYVSGDYRRSVCAASAIKSKFLDQHSMYSWAINDENLNILLHQNQLTFPKLIEQYVATRFVLRENSKLNELYPEMKAREESIGVTDLNIPPLVLAYFLLILGHHKMNDLEQMYDVLCELQVLVHHDDNFHIRYTHRGISWEILGICQQLFGEHQTAYISYNNALNDRYNDFKTATRARLHSLQ